MSAECWSCAEELPGDECPGSKLPCGHHGNEAWEQDACDWCGAELGEEEGRCCACGEQITNGSDECLGCYVRGNA